jgi:hypothetical protein
VLLIALATFDWLALFGAEALKLPCWNAVVVSVIARPCALCQLTTCRRQRATAFDQRRQF